MNLIDDWKKAYKLLSMQAMGLAGALQATWMAIPDDLRTQVPANWVRGIVLGLIILGMVGRVVVQAPKDTPDA